MHSGAEMNAPERSIGRLALFYTVATYTGATRPMGDPNSMGPLDNIARTLTICVGALLLTLNTMLSQLGLIDIHSPPGPPMVDDYHTGRDTIVAGCEDVQHVLPAYPRPYPDYDAPFLDEDTLPTAAMISRIAEQVSPFAAHVLKHTIRESLRLAARRSRQAGNDLAADNLEHFLDNSGETVTDFNVEGLLRDLPVLHELVRQTLNSSVGSLVEQRLAEPSSEPCRQFSVATSPWIVTGIGGTPSIMPNVDIDTAPFSSTFHLLYSDADYPHRAELDVWMAMDPIWYAIGESVVVNTTSQQAEICYQVFIYFPYHWFRAGFVDNVIGLTDGLGISEHYDIEGTSGVRCEGFHIQDDIMRSEGGSPQYDFDGLLPG